MILVYEMDMRFKWDGWYQRDMVMVWWYKSVFVLQEGWVGIDSTVVYEWVWFLKVDLRLYAWWLFLYCWLWFGPC